MSRSHRVDDLLMLMARLRDPVDGCPWDLRQNFASIVPHTLEEVYEVVDTIEREDWQHLAEELGDLLFQVVFYARMGEEQGHFAFSDVVSGIVTKLLRRHPHVFPDGTLESRRPAGEAISEADIGKRWEQIKAAEKAEKARHLPPGEVGAGQAQPFWLDEVPRAMPALKRAHKLQKRAAQTGFDWPEIGPVFDKLREELDELEAEIGAQQLSRERLLDEMGDVLFCSVNLARSLGLDADEALRQANRKFERRFNYIESRLGSEGRALSESSLEEMDALWDAAKKSGL